MHIALFSDFHPATIGGIQSSIRAQRHGLERLGHQVTVFTAPTPESTEPDPGLVVLSAVAGLRVNGFAVVGPTPANNRLIDAEFAARGPIDVVHLHTTYGVAIAGLHAGHKHRIPVVQTIHSRDDAFIEHTSPVPYASALLLRAVHGRFVPHRGDMPRRPESRAARHAWHTMVGQARAADRVLVPSAHFAALLRDHGFDRPITVLSNGIEDELIERARGFRPAADEDPRHGSEPAAEPASASTPPGAVERTRAIADEPLEPPTRPLRVLWCARLSPEKRLMEAIEAVRLTASCTLDVYGTGELSERARAAIEAGGLNGRVRLHGGVSQAECLAAMADHDVLLFPSSGFDTQGMAVLEAVAMGLPVVYCDPDLAESVPEGGGVCTPDPSVAALAATLHALAEDPAELTPMRKILAAHADSSRQSQLTGDLVEVYQDVLNLPHANPPNESNSAVLQTIPTAPGRLPLLGHSVVVLRDALGFVKSLTALGPIVRVYLGPRPAYVLTTPELVRAVGFGEAGKFHREELRETMQEVIRGASNVLSGEPHTLRRRMIAPALRQRRINEYAVTAADLANQWADRLPVGGTVDLVEQAHELVLDIISSTIFTADFTTAAKQEVRQNVPWLLEQVIVRAALPAPVRRLRFLANRRFSAKAARLRAELGAVVAEYRRTDREFPDVASALVHHVDPDTGARLTDAEIVDELLLMLAAGVGSTASILAWVWHEVLTHPDIEAELRRELADFVGTGPVSPDHVATLPYLRLVLLETLRYWAPWVSTHTADGPVTLGGATLPDGAMIVYSPYLIHHNEHYYPAPETFDPDRWFPGRVAEIDKKTVLPFGLGARHCPGNTFALMTITLATAALFANWRATPDPDHRVRAKTRDFVPAPNRVPVVLRPAK
ncbi:cytochrome P450 [Nocardia sp. NPDC051832]|uniref:cytochrome P450 n=1 Tax=Nocardia sp. NPDC051832 TaxID=3155673 RepID=UPI003418B20A